MFFVNRSNLQASTYQKRCDQIPAIWQKHLLINSLSLLAKQASLVLLICKISDMWTSTKYIWALFFCLTFFSSGGQTYTSRIDSLIQVLEADLSDSIRLETCGMLASELRRFDLAKAEAYALEAINIGESKGLQHGEMRARFMLGVIYRRQGRSDQAIATNQQSLALAQKVNDLKWVGANANALGNTHHGLGQFETATRYFLQAIEAYEAIDYTSGLALAYNNLGLVFKAQNKFDQAKKYFLQAIAAHKEVGFDNRIGKTYMNLGNVEENDSLAIHYYDLALQIFTEYQDRSGLASLRISRGSKMIDLGNFEAASHEYLAALEIATTIGQKERVATAKSALGSIYFQLNDYAQAIRYAQEALQLADEIGFRKEKAETYALLSRIFAESDQYEQAYTYTALAQALNDSLYNERSLEITSELEAKYKSQKQETALARQKLEIARQKNMSNRIAIISLVLLLALFLAGMLLYRFRKQKELAEIALKVKKQEAQQLKELNQLRSNFFANISHEFRTPLTLIISPLEQLLQKSDDGIYKTMLRNGKRMLNLVNELLDLSKLEMGKMQLQQQTLDFLDWVRPLVHSFESLAAHQQIKYEIKLPSSPLTCTFDTQKIEKVLSNLLSNAFKFTPEEGRISFEVRQVSPTQILITVEDSGIGMSAESLKHIFNRFYQVDPSESTSQVGSGIGLALTKELIKLHGGSIEVQSQPDHGSSFMVTLPIITPNDIPQKKQPPRIIEREDTASNSTYAASANESDSDLPLVLVVEDNTDLRAYIRSCLQDQWRIEEAKDGEEGLEKALSLIPEVIITDVMMPRINGHEMTRALRKYIQTSHIPIIMLTAKAFVEDRIEGFEQGVDDYLTKPFDTRELVVRIQNLINQRQLLREKYAGVLPHYLNQSERSTNQEDKFIQRLVDVVKQHMQEEDFSVEELSRLMHLSRYQLHRKVKALTGKSISVFVRSIRLAHARQLLEAKSGNVSEIAFQLGFNSVAYFSKSFAEEFGFPPSKLL